MRWVPWAMALWLLLAGWYWALCIVASRSDRALRRVLNQPRDSRGLRAPAARESQT